MTRASTKSTFISRFSQSALATRVETYRPAAILFSDMVGFTRFCAENPPARVLSTLRGVLDLMCSHVIAHGGSVETILGDGIMGVFHGSTLKSREASSAVRCAIAIQSSIEKWNVEAAREHNDAIRLAVGVHYGRVIVGALDYAGTERVIVGDTVNLASRVEGKCRDLNAAILITSSVIKKLGFEGEEAMANRFVNFGYQDLRGRDGYFQLYGWVRKLR